MAYFQKSCDITFDVDDETDMAWFWLHVYCISVCHFFFKVISMIVGPVLSWCRFWCQPWNWYGVMLQPLAYQSVGQTFRTMCVSSPHAVFTRCTCGVTRGVYTVKHVSRVDVYRFCGWRRKWYGVLCGSGCLSLLWLTSKVTRCFVWLWSFPLSHGSGSSPRMLAAIVIPVVVVIIHDSSNWIKSFRILWAFGLQRVAGFACAMPWLQERKWQRR